MVRHVLLLPPPPPNQSKQLWATTLQFWQQCVKMADLSPGPWSPRRVATGGCSPPPSPSPLLPSSPSCTPPETTGWGSRGYRVESKSRTPTSQSLWRPWACRGLRELKKSREECQMDTTNRDNILRLVRESSATITFSTYWELILQGTEMQEKVRLVSERRRWNCI